MPPIIDITKWNQQPWFSTGGTRNKKYIQSPDGVFYYFKKSYKTDGRDYFFEFWSEVIATQVGVHLGFNMLEYVAAIDNGEMGCLCVSMIKPEREELIEGVKYLQAYENSFNPELKVWRELYSFQLIENALKNSNKESYMEQIIEIIIFDSIIGNSDRHQENWAFINQITITSKAFSEIENTVKQGRFEKLPRLLRWIYRRLVDFEKKMMKPEANIIKLFLQDTKGFAPIYDSGSSLGRELSEEKVKSMLKNEVEMNAYLDRGTSEIHWGGEDKKLNHFELIEKLLSSSYCEITLTIIERVVNKFDNKIINEIVSAIDKDVSLLAEKYRLSSERKQLILKLITLRFERLKKIHNARI